MYKHGGIANSTAQGPVRSQDTKGGILVPVSRSDTPFFCVLGSFDPLCVRSPLDTLESGVLFHIMVVETFTCFTRRSTMESGVVSSLPDRAFTPTLESTGWSNQL